MPKTAGQKIRILYVLDILREKSDGEHFLSVAQILSELRRRHGMEANRKSVMDDIHYLEEYGFAIERKAGTSGGFALVAREFEVGELKLLIDMVQSSRFITEKKSNKLIKTLTGFCSDRESAELKRHVNIADRPKSDNETIFYGLDALNRAITEQKQVSFYYCDYDRDKKKVRRHSEMRYIVSPWELTVDDGKYYLVAGPEGSSQIHHYRVDKMEQITVEESAAKVVPEILSENPGQYVKSVFGMFGGTAETVTLQVKNELAHLIFDRFGLEQTDLLAAGFDPSRFRCAVRVVPSPQFYGWIAALGGAQIISPASVVSDYRAFLEEALQNAAVEDCK